MSSPTRPGDIPDNVQGWSAPRRRRASACSSCGSGWAAEEHWLGLVDTEHYEQVVRLIREKA